MSVSVALDATAPEALGTLHHELAAGARVAVELIGAASPAPPPLDLVTGAGFTVGARDTSAGRRVLGAADTVTLRATRAVSLPDTVGPGLRLLVCGLNPSPAAAAAGVGFARPGNRFWPAARAAGLVLVDRDPRDALHRAGVGMTDLVKRTTARAAELHPDEYRAGLERIERLVRWLRPTVVLFVGLAGWRTAVDRRATAGVQPAGLGDATVYVMPSTSGLNASSSLDALTDHLAEVRRLVDRAT